MKKLLCTSLLILLSSALHGVEIINNTSISVNVLDFTFISGIEIYKFPITLAPGEKHIDNDIASFKVYFSSQKVEYHVKALEADSMVTFDTINNKFIVRRTDIIKPIFEQIF